MTEGQDLEKAVAQLQKSISDQSRLTRTLLVACTASMMAVTLVMTIRLGDFLPPIMYNYTLENLDKFVYAWNVIEVRSKRLNNPAAATEPAKEESKAKDNKAAK